MSYEINDLLELAVESQASDIHLEVGQTPVLRVQGEMTPVKGDKLTPEDTEALVMAVTPDTYLAKIKTKGGADFAFELNGKARFRVSVLRSRGHYGMVLRQIPNDILSLEQIGYPEKIKELLTRPRGLVLVTGPTGCGKSTTLAAMIDWINQHEKGHIITIEDPIEYYHPHKKCVVTQREVGVDVSSFAEAVRSALRQDPDVILVGEMRDLETIEAAISAAETGHLVFATLHTTGAARTVDRIVDAFPAESKDQIRTQLASTIVGVISQVLCPQVGGGRIAAYEIMVANPAISTLIRENKTYRIASDIQTGSSAGMILLDQKLLSLVVEGKITADEAIRKAQSADALRDKLAAAGFHAHE
jgi:twitching motility protein PilT